MAWNRILSSWDRGMKFSTDFDTTHRKMIQNGEKLYFQHCTSCHGADGKGVKIPDTDQYLAPSLVDSRRAPGKPEQLVPAVSKLTGHTRCQENNRVPERQPRIPVVGIGKRHGRVL